MFYLQVIVLRYEYHYNSKHLQKWTSYKQTQVLKQNRGIKGLAYIAATMICRRIAPLSGNVTFHNRHTT